MPTPTRYRQNRHELQIDRGPLQIRQTYLTPPSRYYDNLRIRQVEIVAVQNDVRLALSTLLPAGWQMHETDAIALHDIEATCDTDNRCIITPSTCACAPPYSRA